MPATRTPGRPARAVPFATPSPVRHNRDDPDIIVLSSDDDVQPKPSPRKHVVRKQPRKSYPKHSLHTDDVVEISSDDGASGSEVTIMDLKRQVQLLKQENEKIRRDKAKVQKEVADMKAAEKTRSTGGRQLDASELEDNLCCEICTLKMWSPYILPECGHTFCQNCLQDWFSTTLAQHMAANPAYNLNHPNNVPEYAQALLRATHTPLTPQNMQHLAAVFGNHQVPKPEYNCPACRTPVVNRPVEAFTLKSLVRIVAKTEGEQSPRKEQPPVGRKGKGKGKGPVVRTGPWEGFFPKVRV